MINYMDSAKKEEEKLGPGIRSLHISKNASKCGAANR